MSTPAAPRPPTFIDALEPRLLLSIPAASPAHPASNASARNALIFANSAATASSRANRAHLPFIFKRTIAKLPTIEHLYGVSVVGSSAFFTGTKHVPGRNGNYAFSTTAVDILDLVTQRWSSARLGLGNYGFTRATSGSKTLFTA